MFCGLTISYLFFINLIINTPTHMSNGDCIFCKIIAGELPAYKIYEDDHVLAILDINPVSDGHTLIMPKKHSENMMNTDSPVLEQMITVTKRVAAAVVKAFDKQAFNLNMNNGRLAGQIVPHLHWHIIPREEGDGLKLWPSKDEINDAAAKSIVNKIKANLI